MTTRCLQFILIFLARWFPLFPFPFLAGFSRRPILVLFVSICFNVIGVYPLLAEKREYSFKYFQKRPSDVSYSDWINDQLKFYPPRIKGKLRHVVILPEIPYEEMGTYNLEIRAGKSADVQPCGEQKYEVLFERDSRGERVGGEEFFQFPYHFVSFGKITKSIVYCAKARQSRFVWGRSKSFPIKTEHPFVFYAESDVKISYRLWKTERNYNEAEPFQAYYIISD